ncbi:MAG: DUF1493 family protein [Pseudomonadota bacterium]
MDNYSRISQFISDECDYDNPINPDEDIFRRIGITGDDADAFLIAFETTFDVDMRNYVWYFHSEQEGGLDFGGLFFRSPDRLVTRIPITPRILSNSINAKMWSVQYPDHTMPKVRRDLAANWIFIGALAVFLVWLFTL